MKKRAVRKPMKKTTPMYRKGAPTSEAALRKKLEAKNLPAKAINNIVSNMRVGGMTYTAALKKYGSYTAKPMRKGGKTRATRRSKK